MGYKITMIQEPSEMKKQKKREYFMESWTEIQLKDKKQYLRSLGQPFQTSCVSVSLETKTFFSSW